MKAPKDKLELLAPAGDWECAKAAVENGADAIYFGLPSLNARLRATNFKISDLPDLLAFLHQRGVKAYVTTNTLVFSNEMDEAKALFQEIIQLGCDGAIVQDLGICQLIRSLSPDFPIHASTQMTITTAEGVRFARELGCSVVVLARENSIQEIANLHQELTDDPDFDHHSVRLECFVHGALCVAYSGQCLTSEALGGRSANRGECAQACRMPYELISDKQVVDLKNQQYLLSPQDLMGIDQLGALVQAGVRTFKIEGRLKAPEYVANITRAYRKALDHLSAQPAGCFSVEEAKSKEQQHYEMQMAFSRGLFTGWLEGNDNQNLVHGRYAKKRGVYCGEVIKTEGEKVYAKLRSTIAVGDGLVIENKVANPESAGGRVRFVDQTPKAHILGLKSSGDLSRIHAGAQIWKTSDPSLERQWRQSFQGETPRFRRPLIVRIQGSIGESLRATVIDELGNEASDSTALPLEEANRRPLTPETLENQFGRLGNTPFFLQELDVQLPKNGIVPISELNRLRRSLVESLLLDRSKPKQWRKTTAPKGICDEVKADTVSTNNLKQVEKHGPKLSAMVRTPQQFEALLNAGLDTLYCDFEDPKQYRDCVQMSRSRKTGSKIYVAPPRIHKQSERWILKQTESCEPDGILARNYDHLSYFRGRTLRADFSFNLANHLTAAFFQKQYPLERLTPSYDLNIDQLLALLQKVSKPALFEVTIHQRMPLFHMEHCVFCAFMSDGKDYRDCGRPCEKHDVFLRDRVGVEHRLKADAGCRNTLFNGRAQTAAEFLPAMIDAGVCYYRIDLVDESPEEAKDLVESYHQLLSGQLTGEVLWRRFKLEKKLGVTRGQLGRQTSTH